MRAITIREEFIKNIGITNYSFEIPYGNTRADIVTKNLNTTTTYEIKADGDSFARLENQLLNYSEFSNFVYVIVPMRKLKSTLDYLNKKNFKHVGIYVYEDKESGFFFKKIKSAKRSEMKLNIEKAIRSVPRYIIYAEKPSTKGLIQKEVLLKLSHKSIVNLWNHFLHKKATSY